MGSVAKHGRVEVASFDAHRTPELMQVDDEPTQQTEDTIGEENAAVVVFTGGGNGEGVEVGERAAGDGEGGADVALIGRSDSWPYGDEAGKRRGKGRGVCTVEGRVGVAECPVAE